MKIPQRAREIMAKLDHGVKEVEQKIESGEMDDLFNSLTIKIQEVDKNGPRTMVEMFLFLRKEFPENDFFTADFADEGLYTKNLTKEIFEIVLEHGANVEFRKQDRFNLIAEYYYVGELSRRGYLKDSDDLIMKSVLVLRELQMKIRNNPELAQPALFNHFLMTGEVVKYELV